MVDLEAKGERVYLMIGQMIASKARVRAEECFRPKPAQESVDKRTGANEEEISLSIPIFGFEPNFLILVKGESRVKVLCFIDYFTYFIYIIIN